jgi:UDP-GlcNAc:undecaprenyl-phosphate GlcNAc-1-phosphate transferase
MNILFYSMLASIAMILALRRISHSLGLLDYPGGRKAHGHATPLIGGIAMFIAVFMNLLWADTLGAESVLVLEAGGALVLLGAIDDRYGLPVWMRLFIQVLIAVQVILLDGGPVVDLGTYFGSNLSLGTFAVPFTIIAYIGGINAINMIDGADGMAGKMVGISLVAIALILFESADTETLSIVYAMLGALCGFMLFNSRLFIPRALVFMGDAGSMWLGLMLGWLMAHLTNSTLQAEPPLVLWLFGLPLIDTLAVMIRRISRKNSPFKADRTHIHHMLEHAGLSCKKSVAVLSVVQIFLVGVGVLFYWQHASSGLILASFVTLFAAYYYLLRNGDLGLVLLGLFFKVNDRSKVALQSDSNKHELDNRISPTN